MTTYQITRLLHLILKGQRLILESTKTESMKLALKIGSHLHKIDDALGELDA